jgi:hypothetical protein
MMSRRLCGGVDFLRLISKHSASDKGGASNLTEAVEVVVRIGEVGVGSERRDGLVCGGQDRYERGTPHLPKEIGSYLVRPPIKIS